MHRRRGGLLRHASTCRPAVSTEPLESRLHLSAGTGSVTVAAAPPAPVNFVVRPAGPNEHRLSWGDVTGETGYVVLRRGPGQSGFAEIATLAADGRSYVDTIDPAVFPAGTQLQYEVAAVNDDGRSTSIPKSIIVGGPGGTGPA